MTAIARATASLAVSVGVLAAQSGPPQIPIELRARFGFVGPLVVKVGDGITNLQVADVDGDGRMEAVANDARRARLVAISVRDGAATMQPIPTAGQISGYAFASVKGDKTQSLLLVDARGRLVVGKPGGEPIAPPLDLGLGARGAALLTGDLDGDGKADVVAVSRGSLRWVTKIAEQPVLGPVEPMEDTAHSWHLDDVDGDHKPDLFAVVPGGEMGLRLRSSDGAGGFGPWRIFATEGLADAFPARAADGKAALGIIAGSTRRIALEQIAVADDGEALEWWPIGEAAQNRTLPFVAGDIDGDGDEDVVIARPDRAQLAVFEWRGDTFVMRLVPTLSGVASIALGDVDGDGKRDLVVASPEEDALAWVSGAGPIDRFPERLECQDKPVATTVDPSGGVLALVRNDKRDARLLRCLPGQAPTAVADLGRLPADPVRLMATDVGDAAGVEVAFVVPGEGLRVVSPGSDAKKAAKAGDGAGFTKKVADGAITSCRSGDKDALLVVRDRFVRTFRIDEKGQPRVLAQDNGPDGAQELTFAADFDGGRFYFDAKSNRLVRTAQGRAAAVDVPAVDASYLAAHRGAALLLGARGVLRAPFGKGLALRTLAAHEPPTTRTWYWNGATGDFDHDGIADLVVVDRMLPGVHVLAGSRDGLQRALAVPVFETGPSDEPGNEPRELAVGDLDADGRDDFVLIAHDRILVYLQQP